MGVVPNISAWQFPRQGPHLGRRVRVCFHYDPSISLVGTVVRDDAEDPFRTIIQLDAEPGEAPRFVLATECQYSLVPRPGA